MVIAVPARLVPLQWQPQLVMEHVILEHCLLHAHVHELHRMVHGDGRESIGGRVMGHHREQCRHLGSRHTVLELFLGRLPIVPEAEIGALEEGHLQQGTAIHAGRCRGIVGAARLWVRLVECMRMG
jgi:hypothetical protein